MPAQPRQSDDQRAAPPCRDPVADVVGYSKLIGSDEAGTLAQLEALRTEIIEPYIAKHAGRSIQVCG
jgi:class 3 adenylate cyclase